MKTAIPAGVRADIVVGEESERLQLGSRDPAVFDVILPGRLVMRGAGTATLTVKSPNGRASVLLAVFPAGASIRIVPSSAVTVRVGETLLLSAAALDPQGVEFARLGYGHVSLAIRSSQANPILQFTPTAALQVKALRAGTDTIDASVSIHRGPTLRHLIPIVIP